MEIQSLKEQIKKLQTQNKNQDEKLQRYGLKMQQLGKNQINENFSHLKINQSKSQESKGGVYQQAQTNKSNAYSPMKAQNNMAHKKNPFEDQKSSNNYFH
ncbi:unnamed protein product [Paramecium octaurelia]|uniref:Uncharacterized protein n=1 Tax=Paramecium octaurelia TaxID=43137 RepID=A0A8S1VKZ7_PAROT|nr:unnamed protein product [Paramecium octaurelia]